MRFPRESKIELCVSKDQKRVNLHHPYLDLSGPEPLLVATNGVALVALRVEVDDGDVQGHVPVHVLVAARKAAGKRMDPWVGCQKDAFEIVGARFPREDYGEFPTSWRDVSAQNDAPHVRLTLDAKLLAELARAVSDAGSIVALEFSVQPDGNADVRPINVLVGDVKCAVLMPARGDPPTETVERGTRGAPAPRARRVRAKLSWVETCADCAHKPHDGASCATQTKSGCDCKAPTYAAAVEVAALVASLPDPVPLRRQSGVGAYFKDAEERPWSSWEGPARPCARCGAEIRRGYEHGGAYLCVSHVRRAEGDDDERV